MIEETKMKFKPVIVDDIDDEERRASKHALWRMGELSWKLKGAQVDIYNDIIDQLKDVSVILVSRRFGKSFSNLIAAIETCIQHDLAIVKYACPTQKMVLEIILPILRIIFHDAPPELKLDLLWSSDNKLTFPNGSCITIAGTDNGNAEKLRGAYAHLIFCDEAGFMDDLAYVVGSVLLPQTDTTGGKLVMTSTPNFFNPLHEFHTEYVLPAEASGSLITYNFYQSPMLDDHDRIKIINRYKGGLENAQLRCEYLVEIPRTTELTVLAEFYANKKEIIDDSLRLPEYVHAYISGDIGMRDLTIFLFGYYDFLTDTICVLDEWVANGINLNTQIIAEGIKAKEKEHFINSDMTQREPFKRVMDNDLRLVSDLKSLHDIDIKATKKDNKRAYINQLKLMIDNGRFKIHPRCKHLIYHMENARWKKTKEEFDHLSDSIDGEVQGGHADGLDAAIYLVRNVNKKINPYPEGFAPVTENQHQSFTVKREDNKVSLMHRLLGIKKR